MGVVRVGEQTLMLHPSPPGQEFPQIPQFWASYRRSRQMPLQLVSVSAHRMVQWPCWQISVMAQLVLHLPQFSRSVIRFRHAPAQAKRSDGQTIAARVVGGSVVVSGTVVVAGIGVVVSGTGISVTTYEVRVGVADGVCGAEVPGRMPAGPASPENAMMAAIPRITIPAARIATVRRLPARGARACPQEVQNFTVSSFAFPHRGQILAIPDHACILFMHRVLSIYRSGRDVATAYPDDSPPASPLERIVNYGILPHPAGKKLL